MIQSGQPDYFARVASVQRRLSPKAARLATYISEHHVQAAFMSTRELAAAGGVSLATVVRLARTLGYPSFEALRTSIQERVNFDLTGVERLRTLPSQNRSPAALLRRIVDGDLQSLRALAHSFSEPQFERFVDAILSARRVMILGFRYLGPLTNYFAYSLGKIKPNVESYDRADSSLYDRIRFMGAEDVVVGLALARYPVDLVTVLGHVNKLGLRVLAITDSPLSPILPMADVALFVRASNLDFVGSLTAPSALINCVVSEIGVRLGAQAIERLQALEDAASEAGTYVKGADYPERLQAGRLAWQDEDGVAPDARGA
jgi:DNA-binding MurR/RpiR family transcriptional regulator